MLLAVLEMLRGSSARTTVVVNMEPGGLTNGWMEVRGRFQSCLSLLRKGCG